MRQCVFCKAVAEAGQHNGWIRRQAFGPDVDAPGGDNKVANQVDFCSLAHEAAWIEQFRTPEIADEVAAARAELDASNAARLESVSPAPAEEPT